MKLHLFIYPYRYSAGRTVLPAYISDPQLRLVYVDRLGLPALDHRLRVPQALPLDGRRAREHHAPARRPLGPGRAGTGLRRRARRPETPTRAGARSGRPFTVIVVHDDTMMPCTEWYDEPKNSKGGTPHGGPTQKVSQRRRAGNSRIRAWRLREPWVANLPATCPAINARPR